DASDRWSGLLKYFQPLANQLRDKRRQPREIAARPCKAADQTARHRIRNCNKDDGNSASRLFGGQGGEGAGNAHYDIYLERNQLCCKSGKLLEVLPLAIPIFDNHVATLDITEG